MLQPLYVRPLSAEEHAALKAAVRSQDGFAVRRGQVVLASAEGQRPSAIARTYGLSRQAVRDAIRAFNRQGLACLVRLSTAPKSQKPEISDEQLPALKEMLHQSPRAYGKDRSLWTLALVAEVTYQQGLTPRQLSDETVRQAAKRLGANWKRAKRWISSPDPAYERKKGRYNAWAGSPSSTPSGYSGTPTRSGSAASRSRR